MRYIIIVVFFLLSLVANAQQTMMPDVSLVYLDKLIALAKQNYPKVKTYDERVLIGKYNLQKAKADWFNIFTLTYLYSPNNTTTLVNPSFLNGYQIGVYTNIGSLLQKQPAIKVARTEQRIEVLNRDEYNINITTSVKQRYYIYVQQLAVLKWKVQGAEEAETSLKQIKYKFEKGEETLDNYIKTQIYFSNEVQFKIESEGALLIAKSNLEELVGVKLEDIH